MIGPEETWILLREYTDLSSEDELKLVRWRCWRVHFLLTLSCFVVPCLSNKGGNFHVRPRTVAWEKMQHAMGVET